MSKLLEFINGQQDALLSDLENLVNLDTPTSSKALVDQAMQIVITRFQELLGGSVESIPQEKYGNQVKLCLGEGSGSGQILLIAHMDTVWPEGETAKRPFRQEGQRLYGPGIFDMKCGLLQGLYAMYAVVSQYKLTKKMVLFINTDEEVGSPSSRKWIEEEALKSDAVFVLEPALGPLGKLKTSRKGVGRFALEIEGVPAHSGINHSEGVNALQELAHQILYLQGLTDYSKGSTVNVGIASGGTAVNVVSGQARAELDLRIESMDEAERLSRHILNVSPVLANTKLHMRGGIIRPPMEQAMSRKLFASAQAIAGELGFSLEETATGGASDGNFTAALNIPTLDGLGAVGHGAHALDEYVELDSISLRCALLAHLIKEQMEELN
ncbi:M20 family metallopeptidase [Paenibacillus radicis (ex Xue et al. 2023)]|uniref:M20 family metallopeptidase n=1 Tax=Paenibacillus radicis (ex Xue et al. 2023) TaxID=2972489 RepID=A0ABT1YPW4_9BACL|nr:M20 family metallopeptidase [Paenibacillus radicis (ex Xue et al. 2023)]MCR8635224.1 M20 family metallopeptidase [Paenibacillus radicis (ex Xue et al. 2023)]